MTKALVAKVLNWPDCITAITFMALIAYLSRPRPLDYIDSLDIEDFGFEHRDDDTLLVEPNYEDD